MRRLDGFSAFMAYNDVACCYQHTLKIAILKWDDPSEYKFEYFRERFEDSTRVFPFLRWKLRQVPLGVNHPVWVADTKFDLAHHVKRVACPKPGDRRAFCELVSQLYAQPLDKSLPLWQVWIVEGLEDDQVAMVCMLHHAYTDGAGAAQMFHGLFNHGSYKHGDSAALGVDPTEEPSTLKVFARGVIDLPVVFLKAFPRLIMALTRFHRLKKDYIAQGKALPPSTKETPDSPLNTTYTQARTFAYQGFSLDEFKSISKGLGCTINDLLTAVVAGGVRRYYLTSKYPIGQSLVAATPVNMRPEEQAKNVLGNYVANSFVRLPIEVEDPAERLAIVVESCNVMKEYVKATGTPWTFLAMELVPTSVVNLMNWFLHRVDGQLKGFGNLVISNVVGPKEPVEFYGGKVVNWLSIGQLLAGLGVNVTCWSYADKFTMCLMAERKVIADGERFLALMRESLDDYRHLCERAGAEAPIGTE